MPRTKLKLTDLKTGQEYLLLVTKINPKGLLVQSASTLPIGTLVSLSLQLQDKNTPLDIRGAVHKIVEKPSGGKGMIIRFLDLDPEALQRINMFAMSVVEETTSGASQDYSLIPSKDKTMNIAMSDPPKTEVKKKPKKKKDLDLGFTLDEEEAQEAHPGLAGDTRMLQVSEVDMYLRRRKRRSWMRWLFVLAGAGILLTSILLAVELIRRRERTKPIETTQTTNVGKSQNLKKPISEKPRVIPTPEPTPIPKKVVEKQVPPAKTLTSIKVEERSEFLKISLRGDGKLPEPKVSRRKDPKRMIIELPNVDSLQAKPKIAISKNPLLRIRSSKTETSVSITLDLYPVSFPRYDIKHLSNTINIYLYR